MIYTELTVRAMQIAYAAHHGQTDISGVPYIFHPYHVAEQMKDEYAVCAALLHDVVEDTDVTLADLERDFPQEVTEAVRLLTHDPRTDYRDYILAIKQNELARRVKLADLAHNCDESRIIAESSVSPEKLARWREKYALALELLKD
ncbi:MAG: HD domain-containing protein [Ruminococcus sp.]|nr:HD domain-containing protein [Ruminococcus sp.]